MRKFLLYSRVLALLVFAGCGKLGVSEYEKDQRGKALFNQAVNAEQNGDLDGAIKLYKQVMIDEPKAFSAHFMLATLLHDHAEDYIGAIYHYRRYIELEPKSEKNELAQERINIAEHLLAPKILKKVGDSHTGISQAHLLQEASRLNKRISALEGEKAELSEKAQKSDGMLKDLSAENARLRKIVDKVRDDSFVESPEKSLKERVAEDRGSESGGTTSFSKRELDALRREAVDMKASKSPQTVKKPVVEVPSVKSVLEKVQNRLTGDAAELPETQKKVEVDKKTQRDKEVRDTAVGGDLSQFSLFKTKKTDKKKVAGDAKQTYVVQPGDTLMRISTRFYGDGSKWKRIRNANRGQIGPDGRVRAGQIILIP